MPDVLDFDQAEGLLRHIGAHALEGLPDVAWSIERQPALVRLRLHVNGGSAGIRFQTETESGRLEMELVSPDGQRVVNLTLLLRRLEGLAGLRVILRAHESGLDSALVEFDLSALPQKSVT